jgi:hypothetical protein
MVNHICEPISPKSARILSLNSPGARWGQKTAYRYLNMDLLKEERHAVA